MPQSYSRQPRVIGDAEIVARYLKSDAFQSIYVAKSDARRLAGRLITKEWWFVHRRAPQSYLHVFDVAATIDAAELCFDLEFEIR